jgi:DNA-binding MarR family transcriptional regulator
LLQIICNYHNRALLCNNPGVQKKKCEPSRANAGASFLLAQVGAHAAAKFAERLAPMGLMPPHAGILWMLGRSEGLSQQELASRLKIHPSRLVGLLDELQSRGLIERREKTSDRRIYALRLTPQGHTTLGEIGRVSGEHNKATCAALSEDECTQLAELLQRIADQQGLTPGVHPGFSRLGRKG